MEKRIKLSKNGPEFSRIVSGFWKLGAGNAELNYNQREELIEKAIDYGITTFDHADIYGNYSNEAEFGEVLKQKPSLRQKMEIVTKCGIRMMSHKKPEHIVPSYDTSKAHILASVENSLRNLNTDCIDLLLIHRPNPLMNPHEISEAFMKLKQSGKVKFFGVSNFTPSQFEMLNSFTELVTNQVEISLLKRDFFLDGTLDQCITKSFSPMAWSPLGGGNLFRETDDINLLKIKELAFNLAKKYNLQLDHLLVAFLLKHPANIIPVLGSSKYDRLKIGVEALDIELSTMDWFALWQAAGGLVP
jgi:predicted oxidoreductase